MFKYRNHKYISIIQFILKIIVSLIIMLLLFFGSAGTLYWPEAWLFLIIFILYVTFFSLWLKKNNPELLKERTSRKGEGKSWDKIILTIYTILLFCMIITCGFDAVRFRWTQMPFIVKACGFIGYIPACILIFLTMRENAYLSEVVRIQKDRSQQVVNTGPYKCIRHPMYLAIIIVFIATPFALGSFIALSFSGCIVILFIVRTCMEDKTLQNELDGYKEYIEEVKYRLIPGIW